MRTLNRRAILGALTAVSFLVNLSGCVVRDPGYRYENGDRIDRYGHREEHWCDNHHDDEHCH